jgi:diaminopimelate decarboxylase
MSKYRKLPVEIEAIQFTGKNDKNIVDVYNFLEETNVESQSEVKSYGKNFEVDFCNGTCLVGDILIKTLEGDMRASHGDYIIRGVNGELCMSALPFWDG